MPTATRRTASTRPRGQLAAADVVDTSSVDESGGTSNILQAPMSNTPPHHMEVEEPDGDEDESEDDSFEIEQFPPAGLKEISSLASWTVSSAKPGSGVRALRSPDTSQFWQSDGPQPHLLSIHFFKLVSIVHMRIYLDFSADESYTPTKIQFLAGMGVHDIQEFAEMTFDQPMGWIDVDFTRIGIVEDGEEDGEETNATREIDWSKRPVLRAFLVQVRILENHQNGKDTHLRAVQLFARDESHDIRRATPAPQAQPIPGLPLTHRAKLGTKPVAPNNNIKLASWMHDPDLR